MKAWATQWVNSLTQQVFKHPLTSRDFFTLCNASPI